MARCGASIFSARLGPKTATPSRNSAHVAACLEFVGGHRVFDPVAAQHRAAAPDLGVAFEPQALLDLALIRSARTYAAPSAAGCPRPSASERSSRRRGSSARAPAAQINRHVANASSGRKGRNRGNGRASIVSRDRRRDSAWLL